MSVYADQLQGCMPSRGWPWAHRCRLFADTETELHNTAHRLGLKPEWVRRGIGIDWYDLTRDKRSQAESVGVVMIETFADAARVMDECRRNWVTAKAMEGKTGRLF